MTKDEFLDKVLAVLNDAGVASSADDVMIVEGAENLRLIAERLYPSAWRRAVGLFPNGWFCAKSFADSPVVCDAACGTGYTVLPEDYFVLLSFRMRGWKTNCVTAYEETESVNRKQGNEYTRGTPERPVCVLRKVLTDDVLRLALCYYSLPRTAEGAVHEIAEALYVPNVKRIDDVLDVDDRLIEPLVYLCASAVLTSLEKFEAATQVEKMWLG
ncbi:MAG: hypothetical protein LBH80_02830 [Prevotellaceae bacterium]|jgi:hypothetical protein|nr:hypothetical protein [Prevotellaceae bacterium]